MIKTINMTNQTISDLTFQLYLGIMERRNPSESWITEACEIIKSTPLTLKKQQKIGSFYHYNTLDSLRVFCESQEGKGIEETLTTPQAIEEAILKYGL